MKTVAIVARKGGTGKTTVAINLAVVAQAQGLSVVLADMDPQRSAKDWSLRRTSDPIKTVAVKPGTLAPERYSAERSEADLLIIDTRSSSRSDAIEAARSADLSIIVVRPSLPDLWAVADTVADLKALGRPSVFVLNQTPYKQSERDPVIVREALDLLVAYGLPLAPVALRTRSGYQTGFITGRSPLEMQPHGPAAQELTALWEDVVERMWRVRTLVPARPSAPREPALQQVPSSTPDEAD
jgi:chromosome partitioning protein